MTIDISISTGLYNQGSTNEDITVPTYLYYEDGSVILDEDQNPLLPEQT